MIQLLGRAVCDDCGLSETVTGMLRHVPAQMKTPKGVRNAIVSQDVYQMPDGWSHEMARPSVLTPQRQAPEPKHYCKACSERRRVRLESAATAEDLA